MEGAPGANCPHHDNVDLAMVSMSTSLPAFGSSIQLFARDGSPFKATWNEIHPDFKRLLVNIEARMQRYREESELLDESGRLDLDVFSALGSGLHGTAARVSQDISTNLENVDRKISALQELMENVKETLADTGLAKLREYQDMITQLERLLLTFPDKENSVRSSFSAAIDVISNVNASLLHVAAKVSDCLALLEQPPWVTAPSNVFPFPEDTEFYDTLENIFTPPASAGSIIRPFRPPRTFRPCAEQTGNSNGHRGQCTNNTLRFLPGCGGGSGDGGCSGECGATFTPVPSHSVARATPRADLKSGGGAPAGLMTTSVAAKPKPGAARR